jgi:putative sterol carrier protein
MDKLFLSAALALCATWSTAAPVLMTPDWTAQACEAWNSNSILTDELAEKWVKNDKNRGYKIVHMYRTDCGEGAQVEMKIESKDGKARCTYGGRPQTTPDFDVDYLMHANSARWLEMGKGEYGPMKAMMFGRLKFSGPMMEAMSVMGPFEQFLLLVGQVPGETASCPTGGS